MNIYEDFQASLFAFCKATVAELISNSTVVDMDVFKFDAHADLNDIPEKDLMGPMEYSLETDDGSYVGACMIAVTTFSDTNIVRLDSIMNQLYDKLQPGTIIPLVDASTGTQRAVLKVMNGTSVLPVLNTRTRPVKALAAQFGTDFSLGL